MALTPHNLKGRLLARCMQTACLAALAFGFVGALPASAGATQQAESSEKANAEANRIDESHFLKSLDYLIATQSDRHARDASGHKNAAELGVEHDDLRLHIASERDPLFSLGGFRTQTPAQYASPSSLQVAQNNLSAKTDRSENAQDAPVDGEGTYLYLHDRSEADTASNDTATLPDFSGLLAPTGTLRDTGETSFAALGGSAQINLFGPAGSSDAVSLTLKSAYNLIGRNYYSSGFRSSLDQFAREQYALAGSVGYAGFSLDANISRENAELQNTLTGTGLGFSYQSSGWSARIGWTAYREGADLLGLENEERQFISIELGANLRLTENIDLLGGVRYYDYRNHQLVSSGQDGQSQMIFVGGSMRF